MLVSCDEKGVRRRMRMKGRKKKKICLVDMKHIRNFESNSFYSSLFLFGLSVWVRGKQSEGRKDGLWEEVFGTTEEIGREDGL